MSIKRYLNSVPDLVVLLTSGQLQYPGVWQQASMDVIGTQHDIANDLGTRKYSLRDADGYILQVAKDTQESVRQWTNFPKEETLEAGQLKTYIINCPQLHPLTSQILGQILTSMGSGSAAEVRTEYDPRT